jgi:hypothetical protein
LQENGIAEDVAENETCRRMELQKMLQQRMKLLENGIAERKESQKMQQKRMEFTGEWNYRYIAENKSAGKWNCECMSRE